jgi:phenylacetate-CoA ligase
MNTFYLLYELAAALQRVRWSANRLARYQRARLQEIVRHAYETVPYYHKLFDKAGVRPDDIRVPADLSRLPITTKADLQRVSPEERVASNLDPGAFVKELTSGSTGRPFTIQHTQRERVRKSAIYIRTYLQLGLRITDQQACVTEERGQHTHRHWLKALEAFLSKGNSQQGRRRWPWSLIGGRTFIPVFDSVDSQLDQLRRVQPDFLLGFPSALRPIAEAIQERGETAIRPRVVCASAEVLDLETRQIIESAFDVPVFNLYSSMEFGNIAWQCPHCGAMHINADSLIVESVRQDGTPVSPGEIGTLVCTDFDSHAMPFIRYAVGDMGTFTEESDAQCPRYAFPTMGPIEGRVVDRIRRPDGVIISPYQFTCSLELVSGVAQYQVMQEALDKLTVRVVPGRDFIEPDATAEVLARCHEILGTDVAVTVQVVDAIPREPSGKFRVVKSEI